MILASMTDPGAMEVAAFLACLFFLVAGWNQVQSFMDRMKDKPAPGDVRHEAAEKYMTKGECKDLYDALAAKLSWLDNQRIDDARNWSGSRKQIYDEIKAGQKSTTDEITKVRAEMGEMERRLNKADEDRTDGVRQVMNEILEAIGELRGRTNAKG